MNIVKTHSFRSISTRRYYTGNHVLEIQVNGTGYKKVNFELKT